MNVLGLVAVVVFNNLVKEFGELSVALCTSCINTDTRVDVLAAREDTLLERHATLVLFVLVAFPD